MQLRMASGAHYRQRPSACGDRVCSPLPSRSSAMPTTWPQHASLLTSSSKISAGSTSEVLHAMADQAIGAVMLSEGDPSTSLSRLRSARSAWTRSNMPYEAAGASVLLGLGYVSLGDQTSAELEFENARVAFDELGARPDLDRLRSLQGRSGLASPPSPSERSGLSNRELEILTHVASGQTNREIAAALTISQHTVGRHLENIFAKLGVSSRVAATAYAYEHDLL